MSSLHILNGDAITPLFEQSGLAGDVFVWAEVLCEGRSGLSLTSQEHWQHRAQHLSATYDFFSNNTFDKLKSGFLSIDLEKYTSIYLWFEYDLFCQINMMALLAWLASKKYDGEILVICSGKHPQYDRLVGLGELSPAQFAQLINEPVRVGNKDLTTFAELWGYWCSGQHDKLVEGSEALDRESFPYMQPALLAHCFRFPDSVTQLTEIESHILNLLKDEPMTEHQLVGQLFRREDYYGFGDVQYSNLIKNLVSFIREEDGLLYPIEKPNKKTKILTDSISRERYFGGAKQRDFKYDQKTRSLLKSK